MTLRSDVIRLCTLLSAVAAILVALAVTWHTSTPRANSGRKAPVGIELSHEATGEYSRRHITRSNGVLARTEIVYRDGGRGLILYRSDGTRSNYDVTTAEGWKRVQVVFDATGTFPVQGFELRADKTMKWQTETLPDGGIKTVTYWRDGKQVFAESVRNLAGDVVNTTYFRQDGVIWGRHSKWPMAMEPKVEEDLHFQNGSLQRTIRFPRYAPEVTYFHENGRPYFMHTFGTWSDEGGTSILLDTATIYGADGRKVAEVQFLWTHVSAYTIYNADGSHVRHHFKLDGTPEGLTIVDQAGAETKRETGADPNLLKNLDPAIRNAQVPEVENLFAQWAAAEAK